MAKYPDFIIVGPMKTGTTAMWHNLNQHTDITMCNNRDDPKKTSTEIRFWASRKPYFNFKKGTDWYKSLFSGDICGEKDAEMIEYKQAMSNLSIFSPNTKIILSVREPSSRAYSEFQMNTRMKRGAKAFRKKFDGSKTYWEKGRYLNLIESRILPFFPKENLFVTVFEWMKQDTSKELNRLYDFLGVEELRLGIMNQSFDNRDTRIGTYKNWDSGYPKMREEDKKYLKKKYSDDNNKLFEFLGYDIEEWQ